jgi:hypothetical protein
MCPLPPGVVPCLHGEIYAQLSRHVAITERETQGKISNQNSKLRALQLVHKIRPPKKICQLLLAFQPDQMK